MPSALSKLDCKQIFENHLNFRRISVAIWLRILSFASIKVHYVEFIHLTNFIKFLLYARHWCKHRDKDFNHNNNNNNYSLMESKIQTGQDRGALSLQHGSPPPQIFTWLLSSCQFTSDQSLPLREIFLPQYSSFPIIFNEKNHKTKHLLTSNSIFKYLYVFLLSRCYKEHKAIQWTSWSALTVFALNL